MAKTKRPDPGTVLEMAGSMESAQSERDDLYDRLDRLYYQTGRPQQDGRSDGVQIVTTPLATNTVDLVCDLAAQQELVIEVPADGESQQAQKQADDMEAWLRAWLSLNQRYVAGDVTGQMAWLAAMRACVIAKTIFTDALVEKGDDGYRVVSVPVVLRVRDPRYCYVQEGVNGIEYVIERWTRKAGDIRRLYPGTLADDKIGDDTDIVWTEYWDDTWRLYFAQGQPVRFRGQEAVPHGFGCVPYAVGRARQTPARVGVVSERPLLAAVETTVRNIDTWMSILATAGWSAVTNAWVVKSQSYGADGRQLALGPGDTNYFAREDSVEPIQRAPLPGDFFQFGTILQQQFQSGTFPLALYGQVEGSMAGYAINLLSQSGRRVLLPIWHAIETAYEQAIRNTVMICRNKVAPLTGDKVPLMIVASTDGSAIEKGRKVRRQLVLDTSKVDESFDVQVTLGDPMPQDEAQNLRMAIEATQAGLLSQQTALDKFQVVPDGQAEIERVGIEQMMKQLLGPELLKLAMERGYLPRNLQVPEGFTVTPEGKLVPNWIAQAQQQGPPPGAPGGPGGMPQGPSAADMQALAGMPPAMPEMEEMSGEPPMIPGMV